MHILVSAQIDMDTQCNLKKRFIDNCIEFICRTSPGEIDTMYNNGRIHYKTRNVRNIADKYFEVE